MPRVFISAAHKSSGKTTVSIGLCSILTQRGYQVQPFKKGPDYIDPMWLGRATGHPCFNLDFNTQTIDEINQMFDDKSSGMDLSFIEGNKGLYDGMDPDGSDCNAALAKQLNAPVILVVDTQGITRGVAPLINGYRAFDSDVNIVGVILNKVAGKRHEAKLKQAIEKYCDIPVLGAIHRHPDLMIDERHLGLVPSNEHGTADRQIQTIHEHIERQVDIDELIHLLGIEKQSNETRTAQYPDAQLRIGIAQDSAFGFYYQDDLETFKRQGAELVSIDLLRDDDLPEIDGLFIGGGFPETHMPALSENTSMRKSIHTAIENGLPVYAECGGLMYLCRGISWQEVSHPMVGAIPADVQMHERPQGRGYVRIQPTGDAHWQANVDNAEIRAHEFHHSSLENLDDDLQFAHEVKRGHGIDGKYDGVLYRNVVAGYAHLRSTQASPWVGHFVEFVKNKMEISGRNNEDQNDD